MPWRRLSWRWNMGNKSESINAELLGRWEAGLAYSAPKAANRWMQLKLFLGYSLPLTLQARLKGNRRAKMSAEEDDEAAQIDPQQQGDHRA